MTKHKALVAVELEALAKKFDRFGWERDHGKAAQDRLIMDWIEALCDFPLDEIQAACREAVRDNPDKMPNEGHILKRIIAKRAEIRRAAPKPEAPRNYPSMDPEAQAERKRKAEEILAGFKGARE